MGAGALLVLMMVLLMFSFWLCNEFSGFRQVLKEKKAAGGSVFSIEYCIFFVKKRDADCGDRE
jgi:hypothetical protein